MKFQRFYRAGIFITLLLLALSFTACSKDGKSQNGRVPGQVLISEATEKKTIKNAAAVIDISNVDQGYICVKYLGKNKKVKLQLTKDNETYTYNLLKREAYEIFPLSDGSGAYTVSLWENIGGEQYTQACAETVNVKLEDENLPFLYPNEYVNYTADDPIVALSKKVTADSSDDLSKVEKVFNYVTKTIVYDYKLAENVESDYLPDIDQVLKRKKGICFDYASVMCAMLRIQDIPSKLVVGYAGDVYHAWISIYTEDQGWLDGVIQFDGKDWTMLDPTTAASSGELDDITKDSSYNALYFY